MTTTRQARGREEVLARDPLPLALAAALDAIARQRATGEPLERAVADVAARRHLGPRERRATGDAVFAWARRKELLERRIEDALTGAGGIKPGRHDKDLAALVLAELASGIDVSPRALERLPDSLRALVDDVAARGLGEQAASLPPWLSASLTRAYPTDHAALVAALGVPAPLVLAIDPRATTVAHVIAAIHAAKGVTASPSPVVPSAIRVDGRFSLASLPPDVRSAVWPMDDGSQAIVHAVDAGPSDMVLDLCAGGGGKSRLLVAHGAKVVSADISFDRLRAALGTPHVVTDGTRPAFAAGRFDRVLVDAPCSGTGTLRRAPDLASRLDEADVGRFAETQRTLLVAAAGLVKPGGTLVYATCSLLPQENDVVVDAVLAARDDLRLVPVPWTGTVRADGSTGRARLAPHTHGTDGFFVATFTRQATATKSTPSPKPAPAS